MEKNKILLYRDLFSIFILTYYKKKEFHALWNLQSTQEAIR